MITCFSRCIPTERPHAGPGQQQKTDSKGVWLYLPPPEVGLGAALFHLFQQATCPLLPASGCHAQLCLYLPCTDTPQEVQPQHLFLPDGGIQLFMGPTLITWNTSSLGVCPCSPCTYADGSALCVRVEYHFSESNNSNPRNWQPQQRPRPARLGAGRGRGHGSPY